MAVFFLRNVEFAAENGAFPMIAHWVIEKTFFFLVVTTGSGICVRGIQNMVFVCVVS